jgi:hypothetical protein
MVKRYETENVIETLGESYEYTRSLLNVKIDQAKLEITEKVSTTISEMVTVGVLFSILSLTMVFACIALAFYIGSLLESNAIGFAAVALLLLCVSLGFYAFRRQLITSPVIRFIIRKIYE